MQIPVSIAIFIMLDFGSALPQRTFTVRMIAISCVTPKTARKKDSTRAFTKVLCRFSLKAHILRKVLNIFVHLRQFPHGLIRRTYLQQFFMSSHRFDLTVFYKRNLVSVYNGSKAMCHDNQSLFFGCGS